MAISFLVKADGVSRLLDEVGNFLVVDDGSGAGISVLEAADTVSIVGVVSSAAPRLADRVIDFGLGILNAEVNRIVLCSANPTTFTEANSTLKVGHRDFSVGTAIGLPSNAAPNGRQVATSAFTAGTVTATAVARAWALLDTAGQRLLVNGDLGAPYNATIGQSFQLPSFVLRQPSQ